MYSNTVCSAPNSATVFVAADSLISAMTTKPPPSTIPLTTSFPIPFAPPVTIATFPEKFIKITSFDLLFTFYSYEKI